MSSNSEVSAYIENQPIEVQDRLRQVRQCIREMAPTAKESISYGMPAYKVNGKVLAYFGAYQKHLGFYATPSVHAHFAKEMSKYKGGKGSVQFPFAEPLPIELISNMIRFKLTELA